MTSDGIGRAKSGDRSAGVPAALHRVEVLLDDLADPRLEPAHPAHGELGGEHPPQPGVVGRIERQWIARPHSLDLGLIQLRQIRQHAHHPGVAEPRRIREHLAHVLVTGEHPRVYPERCAYSDHPPGVAQIGELRNRVEALPAHVDGQFADFR